MSVIFKPRDFSKRVLSEKQIAKMITNNLTLNRVVLAQMALITNIPKNELEKIALRVIKSYKDTYEGLITEGKSKRVAIVTALNDKKLLVNRVKNEAIYQISKNLKERYAGYKYRWLPSNADTPDPIHQLKYNQIFTVGVGEMPQERAGCQCGMEILVDEDYTI